MESILTLDVFNNQTLQPGPDGVPDFAGERFIYFGDQANMPYGNYPAQGREPYLRELILKDTIFLLGTRAQRRNGTPITKPPVKAIVIACNTATAYGIDDIRAALQAWHIDVPVIGVVEAGARAVNERLPADGNSGTVAVLATVGTCSANAYPKAIRKAAGMAGKPAPPIIQQGSIGLAGAVEGNPAFIVTESGKRPLPYLGPSTTNSLAPLAASLLPAYRFDPGGLLGDPGRPESLQLNSPANYSRYDVTSLVESYRQSGGATPITTVVLGCTHFPIVQSEIANAFSDLRSYRDGTGTEPYRGLIAERLEFVSPSEFTARELFRELARHRLRARKEDQPPPTLTASYISVPNPKCPGVQLAADGSFDSTYKYGRELGQLAIEDFLCVPMSDAALPLDSLAGLARALPTTWRQLQLSETVK